MIVSFWLSVMTRLGHVITCCYGVGHFYHWLPSLSSILFLFRVFPGFITMISWGWYGCQLGAWETVAVSSKGRCSLITIHRDGALIAVQRISAQEHLPSVSCCGITGGTAGKCSKNILQVLHHSFKNCMKSVYKVILMMIALVESSFYTANTNYHLLNTATTSLTRPQVTGLNTKHCMVYLSTFV